MGCRRVLGNAAIASLRCPTIPRRDVDLQRYARSQRDAQGLLDRQQRQLLRVIGRRIPPDGHPVVRHLDAKAADAPARAQLDLAVQDQPQVLLGAAVLHTFGVLASGKVAAAVGCRLWHATCSTVECESNSRSKTVKISIPHPLGRDEAKRRIQGQLRQLRNQSAGLITAFEERWSGDVMELTAAVLATRITGRLRVEEQLVDVDVDLPWFLAALTSAVRQAIESNTRQLLEHECGIDISHARRPPHSGRQRLGH